MKILKMIATLFISLIFVFACAIVLFLQHPKFGKLPSGARLEKIKKSKYFKDGNFQNLHLTPDLTEGVSYYAVMKEFILDKKLRNKPSVSLPTKKTDLLNLSLEKDMLVWFGHASYFFQVDGKKFLVDPVLSGSASPLAFTTKSYPGTDLYSTDEIPEIDYLFISHDHWDHLDYETLLALKPKIKKTITGLGTGAHLEHWGFDPLQIIEKEWHEKADLGNGFTVTATPARHFSGRAFSRNRALWISFVLQTPTKKIYIGGDSGYDTHFAEIGDQYGPFDLAFLECGQYDKSWKYIHMMPEEVVHAAQDLKAKRFMPIHWAKFSLGNHAWDEPILRVTTEARMKNVPIIHPFIGEEVNLRDDTYISKEWWKGIE